MIGIFRCLARRTTGPPKSPGRPRSPRLEVEVLEQRALPGNVPFGALLLPPGLHATLGSHDAVSVPDQTWTDSRGSGGSVSAAAVVAAASAPTNADPPASAHVLSGTDLDSLGGAAPLAIPLARTNPFGGPAIHFDLPGLPTNPPPVGNDPSTINDFNGFIGVAHLQGTGTDGSGNTLNWDADLRFMQGIYQGADGQLHSGTFAFV